MFLNVVNAQVSARVSVWASLLRYAEARHVVGVVVHTDQVRSSTLHCIC
jgi:hypothetical protein